MVKLPQLFKNNGYFVARVELCHEMCQLVSGADPDCVALGGKGPRCPACHAEGGRDFKYLGVIKLDSAKVGIHASGLAYRASTNTFFLVGNGGAKPFNLYEIANADPSLDAAKAETAPVVHAANTFLPSDDKTQQWDSHRQPCWIETREPRGAVLKQGIIHFSRSAIGYGWYGNPDSHCDSSPAGAKFQNNLDSLIWPGKKCQAAKGTRGGHAEAYVGRYYLTDPAAVLAAAGKVKQGTATPAALQVRWSEAVDVLTLGGSMAWHGRPGMCPDAEGMAFDAHSGRLYVLFSCLDDFSAIQVWQVR